MRNILINITLVMEGALLLCAFPGSASGDGSEIAAVKSPVPKNISCANGALRWKTGRMVIDELKGSEYKVRKALRCNNIKTAEEYARWLRANIKYRRDVSGDSWLLPEKLLEQKCGDCEDMAFLSCVALRIMGYEPYVIAFKKNGGQRWHAVCAFDSGGRYFYTDNNIMRETDAQTLEKLVEKFKHEGDIVILNEDGASNMSREAVNLKNFAKGTRIAVNNGILSIISE